MIIYGWFEHLIIISGTLSTQNFAVFFFGIAQGITKSKKEPTTTVTENNLPQKKHEDNMLLYGWFVIINLLFFLHFFFRDETNPTIGHKNWFAAFFL